MSRPSEQDPDRRRARAALSEQPFGKPHVDILARREDSRLVGEVARFHQDREAPLEHDRLVGFIIAALLGSGHEPNVRPKADSHTEVSDSSAWTIELPCRRPSQRAHDERGPEAAVAASERTGRAEGLRCVRLRLSETVGRNAAARCHRDLPPECSPARWPLGRTSSPLRLASFEGHHSNELGPG